MARLPGEDRRPEETARSRTPPSPRQSEAQGFEQGLSPPGLWDALAVGGALCGELLPTRSVTQPRCPRRGSIRRFPLERREKSEGLKEVDRTPLPPAFTGCVRQAGCGQLTCWPRSQRRNRERCATRRNSAGRLRI